MILFDGRKRWRIWTAEAAAALCPSFAHGHDAIFDDDVADEIDDDGIGGGGGGGGDRDDDGGTVSDDETPKSLVSCVDRCDDLGEFSANTRRIVPICAGRYEAVLEPGECMFVPAGCPHAVRGCAACHDLAASSSDDMRVAYRRIEVLSQNARCVHAGA